MEPLAEPLALEGGVGRVLAEGKGVDAAPGAEGAAISGLVIAVDGQPVPGETVKVWGEEGDGSGREISSREDGSFLISELAAGVYMLAPSAVGEAAMVTRVEVEDGQWATDVCVVTYGTKTLTGHLRGPSGEPVAEGRVYLDVAGDEESAYLRWPSLQLTAQSDENGAFRFDGVPQLPTTVFVSPAEYTTETLEVEPFAETVEVKFRGRDKKVVVTGRVLDPSGAPVAGARVEEKGLAIRRKGTTDDAGRFTFKTAASGEPDVSRPAAVEAWAPGFAPVRVEFPVVGDRAGPVDVVLREAFALEGQVVDAEGHPIRAGLTLYEAGKSLHKPSLIRMLDGRFHKSTAEGGFRIEHLWGAAFDVEVRVGTETHSVHRLDPREGPFVLGPRADDSRINFEVGLKDSVTGDSIESFFLGTYVDGSGGGSRGPRARNLARAVEIGPAQVAVRVRAEGYAGARLKERRFEPGNYSFEIPMVRVRAVRLRVVDGAGLPVRGLRVRFPELAITEGEFAFVTLGRDGATELDGRCWIDDVPETVRELEIFDAAGEVRLARHRLRDEASPGEVSLVLRPR